MDQERLQQIEPQTRLPSDIPCVMQGDDLIAFDEYELALAAFRE
jgi:hypothetical protein